VSDLSPTQSAEIARRVREELSRRRLSRQALADAARISLSTLEKALAGTRPLTLASVVRIEAALDLVLRGDVPAASGETAPAAMGAYSRAGVAWLEGRYLTLRPSFGTPGGVYAYVTTVAWANERGHLAFAESQRIDARFEQAGHVSLPALSGHIYLVTNELGQYRVAILGRPTIEGSLFGVLATLQVGPGSQLVPVACPVALVRLDDAASPPSLGLVTPDAPAYPDYAATVRRATADDFVRLYTLADDGRADAGERAG